MPNGKMWKINPKTGLKYPPRRLTNLHKAERLEEGLVTARLKADLRFKKSKKGIETSLRDCLESWIKSIHPLELAAILGTTYLVKSVIARSEALLNTVVDQIIAPGTTIVFPSEWWGYIPFAEDIARAAGWKPTPQRVTLREAKSKIEIFNEWQGWLISFCIAYIIVKHGGQLLGLMKEGTGTLATVIGALMGVAT